MTTLRTRIHPEAVVIYDYLQLDRTVSPSLDGDSGAGPRLDGMAADQSFRHFMRAVADAAGWPQQWPTNELTIALTHDPEIRALARFTAGADEQLLAAAQRTMSAAAAQ